MPITYLDDKPESKVTYLDSAASAAPQPRNAMQVTSDIATAPLQAAAHLASSAIAAPVAGLAGLATLPFKGHEGASDTIQSVSNAMTYEPKSPEGKAVANVATLPFQMLGKGATYAGEHVTDATGSPAAGATINTAINALPLLVGARAMKGPAKVLREPVAPNPIAATARDAGLSLTPEKAGGPIGKLLQGLSGSAKLERSMSMKNAPRVNALAAEDVGISGTLSKSALSAAAKPHLSVYNEVSQIGKVPTDKIFSAEISQVADRTGSKSFGFDTPPQIQTLKENYGKVTEFESADAVAKIRQLRRDGNSNIGARYNPEQQALGRVQRQIADALENQLDRRIQADPSLPPDLITQYREARRGLAKISTVEQSLIGSNVSPRKLARAGDRVPLDGNLKIIADSAREFDRSFQDVSKIRDSGPFGYFDALLGAGGALANPALAAAVFARPTIRGAMASDMFQNAAIGKGRAGMALPSQSMLVPLASQLADQSNRHKLGLFSE